MQTLKQTTGAAFKVDFSNVERGFALRCSIGVAIPLVAAVALGAPQLGVSAALGALSTGFASQQGVYRTRAAAMIATACGMAFSMLVGGYAVHSSVAIVFAAAVWGYAYGLLSSLGNAAAAVGLNSLVALVIADAFAQSSTSGVPLQALLVLAGGLEQTLLVVMLWPARRYSAERHALGDAYRALGRFARDIASGSVAAPHPSVIATARQTLADPAPFARRGSLEIFQALVDEAERIRAGLGALVTDRYRYDRRNESGRASMLGDLGNALSPLLEEMADALHEARAPVVEETAWSTVEHRVAALDALPGAIGRHARLQGHALLGQLRTAFRLGAAPARGDGAYLPIMRRSAVLPRVRQWWITLRANLSFASPYGRHAVRLAVAVGAAMLLARAGPFHHGYWIPMTAALVLRPDFRATFTRGIARIGGTIAGAVLATAIVAALPQSPHVTAALAVLFAALGYFVFGLNYALYSLTVTAYVVFLLALVANVPEHAAVLDRTIATLCGAGIAAVAYLAWPTWESGRARLMLAAQLESYREYAEAILAGYVDPQRRDSKRVLELQTAAWRARAMAEASVDAMIAEPRRTRLVSPRVAVGVLAAEQRIGVALLALNAYSRNAQAVRRAQLEPFVATLDRAWRRCVALLRDGEAKEPMPALRESYRELERQLEEAGDADAAVILAESDLLVDGVNTVAELAGSASSFRR